MATTPDLLECLRAAVLITTLVAGGCANSVTVLSRDGGTTDTPDVSAPDAAPDAARDVAPDAAPDVAPDAARCAFPMREATAGGTVVDVGEQDGNDTLRVVTTPESNYLVAYRAFAGPTVFQLEAREYGSLGVMTRRARLTEPIGEWRIGEVEARGDQGVGAVLVVPGASGAARLQRVQLAWAGGTPTRAELAPDARLFGQVALGFDDVYLPTFASAPTGRVGDYTDLALRRARADAAPLDGARVPAADVFRQPAALRGASRTWLTTVEPTAPGAATATWALREVSDVTGEQLGPTVLGTSGAAPCDVRNYQAIAVSDTPVIAASCNSTSATLAVVRAGAVQTVQVTNARQGTPGDRVRVAYDPGTDTLGVAYWVIGRRTPAVSFFRFADLAPLGTVFIAAPQLSSPWSLDIASGTVNWAVAFGNGRLVYLARFGGCGTNDLGDLP